MLRKAILFKQVFANTMDVEDRSTRQFDDTVEIQHTEIGGSLFIGVSICNSFICKKVVLLMLLIAKRDTIHPIKSNWLLQLFSEVISKSLFPATQ